VCAGGVDLKSFKDFNVFVNNFGPTLGCGLFKNTLWKI